MYQEREFQSRNWAPFPFPPDTIEAVFITHAHIDHCGLLPKLVRDGFRGKIYCTPATSDISQIILMDAARIQVEDAELKRKRHEREGRQGPYPEIPLYTEEDVAAVIPHFAPVGYGKTLTLGKGLNAAFYDAGHVLGSAMVRIEAVEKRESVSVLFSGDIGRWARPILPDPSSSAPADYIVVESTYGDRRHSEHRDISDELAGIVNDTVKAGGNIVVPSFALQRTQEILYYMHGLLEQGRIPHIMVFLDSPMAAAITEVYKRHAELFDNNITRMMQQRRSPFDFPGLKIVQTADESKMVNHIKGTVMVLAGAGMCTGGRIKHHLVTNISRPESTILFVGYQAVGTLGRQILDGASSVRIFGQSWPVYARIARIEGFSAHGDREELLTWLKAMDGQPKRIFVVHGEAEAASAFSQYVSANTGWPATVPAYGSEVLLT